MCTHLRLSPYLLIYLFILFLFFIATSILFHNLFLRATFDFDITLLVDGNTMGGNVIVVVIALGLGGMGDETFV
jgi:hypothetical protein